MSYYKVVYDKLFPYAPYLNERIGIEILVESSQDPMDAIEEARKIVHDFRNKHIQAELSHQLEPIPDRQVEKSTEIPLEDHISNCLTLEELAEYKIIASTTKELKSIYLKKLKQLSNGII
jgi:hypothetical protein